MMPVAVCGAPLRVSQAALQAVAQKVIEQLIRIFVEQSEAFLIFLLHQTLQIPLRRHADSTNSGMTFPE